MKNVVNIRFEAGTIPGRALAILKPAGVDPARATIIDFNEPDGNAITVYLELDEHDKRIAKVVELLAQYGLKPDDMFTSIEYSEEDRQSARLLAMTHDINNNVLAGAYCGTKYDMSHACFACGTGARQSSPLYVKYDYVSRLKQHRAIGSSDGHIIVDGGIAKKLLDHGITGIAFGDVYERTKSKKRRMLAREQVLVTHTLPPMTGKFAPDDCKGVCKVCQRGGFDRTPEKPYHSEDLREMQDFNLTWEWFGHFDYHGNLRKATLSMPLVLVTPKVMNIFREAGVKSFEWTPIFVDE